MVNHLGFHSLTFFQALFTKRLLFKLPFPNMQPFGGLIEVLGKFISPVPVVLFIRQLLMFLTVLSVH